MAAISFNPVRFQQFIYRQVSLYLPSFLYAAGGIFGVLLLLSVVTAYFNPGALDNVSRLYMVVMFISGFLFAGRFFTELNTTQSSYLFLTLPVSTLEKTLGSWLLSSPVFVAVYMAGASIILFLSGLVAKDLSVMSNLYDMGTLKAIGAFLVLQTVFFLGATTFKKNAFFKTLLGLFVLVLGFSLFVGIVMLLMFKGGNFSFDYNMTAGCSDSGHWLGTLLWILLAPYLLLISYFKLKERQA